MPDPAQQIRFCTSRDGTRIAYATCGMGPPLLWIGHWARHLEFDWESPVWRPWLLRLTRRHSVVRYDWRGCGLSDREEVNFSLERHIEDLAAVVDAAGRVHGTRGLTVADASVMPDIPSANTHLPTIMIAERIASLLVTPGGTKTHQVATGRP